MRNLIVALAGGVALFSAPAAASVFLENPSSFNGEEILFNTPDAITSGTQVLGFTNGSHTGYFFEGTTIDGNSVSGNLLEATGGAGQAVITASGYSTNKYPRLTSLTYYRQDGGTFNNTEFKLEDLQNFVRNVDLSVRLYAYDQNNVEYDLGLLGLGGPNRFGIAADGGDSISRVYYVVSDGAIGRHKQTRVENVAPMSAVPEPATWLMMLLGFGFVGGTMRLARQRRWNSDFRLMTA